MSFQQVMQIDKELRKVSDSLEPRWKTLGVSPEVYLKDLTIRWRSINALLKSGGKDTSVVKSTIKETLELIVWVHTKRELTSSIALIENLIRQAREANDHKSQTKRIDKRT